MNAMWNEIEAQAERLKPVSLRALFDGDAERFSRLSRSGAGLTIDFSKEKIDAAALDALLALAEMANVAGQRDAMLAGEAINLTEGRAVLHVAARDPDGSYDAPGADEVGAALDRFLAFAEDVRAGRVTAADGAPFTDVVSIGIGGSDLGPVMATRALVPYADGPRVQYVANVDGSHFADVSRDLDPARTLVIVQSKTFTTQETMTNAATARAWLAEALGGEGAKAHLAAVSTNLDATAEFGIAGDRVFGFWDWIGGRYSIWSAIGLPLALAIGANDFRAFLSGARAMDAHFRDAAPHENLPMLMGLLGVWRRNGMGCGSVAVIPYDERLARLPAYLQQLTMESNGKRVTRSGETVERNTCPVVWGEPGTNAQHSFFQLLHQGTDVIPVDFLLAANAHEAGDDHHAKLTANCLAQSKALAFGKTEGEVREEMTAKGAAAAEIDRLAPHRTFPGDRPSTTIVYSRLDPATLGAIIALYEHKTFVEAAIWGINAFDQWGVELGKALAQSLLPMVERGVAEGEDASTTGLLATIGEMKR